MWRLPMIVPVQVSKSAKNGLECGKISIPFRILEPGSILPDENIRKMFLSGLQTYENIKYIYIPRIL